MSATTRRGESPAEARENRRFSVSSNRGRARHRIRYVEAGGASVDIEECTFCQSNPELDWDAAPGDDHRQDGAPDCLDAQDKAAPNH